MGMIDGEGDEGMKRGGGKGDKGMERIGENEIEAQD